MMTTSLDTVRSGGQTESLDDAWESSVRELAARRGLRLEQSRRLTDRACGTTIYWLFDVSTRRRVSPPSGWTIDDVHHYLTR